MKAKQQFTHRRMRFYQANFEQNILFAPIQLHELSSYFELYKPEKLIANFFQILT